MKKFYAFALLAASICGTAAAGNGYIGGSLGFEHNESKGSPATNEFRILPELGYNLNDKWAIGTTIGYDYKHFCGYDTDSHIFEFNPYARYSYFRTDNNLVQLFVDGGAGIGCGWYKVGDEDGHTSVIWNIGFRPGVAFNLTDSFSIVTHIGFLGYEGANNAAYDAGYNRRGGLMFDTRHIDLGFYFNF